MVAISVISPMVLPIWPIAATDWPVELWISATRPAISSVARAVWVARLFTSLATTAKPLPASPARADSMVALSASRLVWLAIAWISCTTVPIRSAESDSARIKVSVRFASSLAWSDTETERATWVEISLIEAAS